MQVRQQELVIRVAAYILLVVLSIAISLLGIFLIPTGPVIFGLTTSVAWPVVAVGNIGLVAIAQRLDSWRYSCVLAIGIWFTTVVIFSMQRPDVEEIVIRDTAAGYVYLLVGVLAAGVGLGKALPSRGRDRRRNGGR